MTTPVSLVTTIAGEDIPGDRLKVSSETVLSNTNTHNAVTTAAGGAGTLTNAQYSGAVDCSGYRGYAMAAWGGTGNVQALLQCSYDGGGTWIWHPNGIAGTTQQFLMQAGTVNAPLCRVAVTNQTGSPQAITAYLCLQR